MNKQFINHELDDSEFRCPCCSRKITVDVKKYKASNKPSCIKVICECGEEYSYFFEKRKFERVQTNLEGVLFRIDDSGSDDIIQPIKIIDISRTGLKFQPSDDYSFKPGEIFMLNIKNIREKKPVSIKKRIIIRKVFDSYSIGAEFANKN